jgi:hypothetical protein
MIAPDTDHTAPVFLLTPQAAGRIGLAAGTLEKLRVRGGGPPFLRLSPRRIVYAIDALDSWARGREFTSTSEYAGSPAA